MQSGDVHPHIPVLKEEIRWMQIGSWKMKPSKIYS